LIKKGLVKGLVPVKILGDGNFTRKLTFKVGALSAQAREKIEKAGGTVSAAARDGGGKTGAGVNDVDNSTGA
jgi:large subunit ribosomal protein L15